MCLISSTVAKCCLVKSLAFPPGHAFLTVEHLMLAFSIICIGSEFQPQQVMVTFCLTVLSSHVLSQAARRNKDVPSILCLKISSVKYPSSSLPSSVFHTTARHNLAGIFCWNITKVSFPPISNNDFFISFGIYSGSLDFSVRSVISTSFPIICHYQILKLLPHFWVFDTAASHLLVPNLL